MIQEEISHVVEKKDEVIDEIKDVPKDHGNVKIVNVVKISEFFEKKYQVMGLVEINCEMDTLIEDYGTTKIDAIVSVGKIKGKHSDVENLSSGNYYFLVLADFISDMDELNY